MLKLMIGVKGTGKTKTLIEKVNAAAATSHGDVVCIEKGTVLRFDIKSKVRLIDTEEYLIHDAGALYALLLVVIPCFLGYLLCLGCLLLSKHYEKK